MDIFLNKRNQNLLLTCGKHLIKEIYSFYSSVPHYLECLQWNIENPSKLNAPLTINLLQHTKKQMKI